MSKMNDYVIDLHEKGLISLDTNGDYIMNNDHFPPQPEPVEEKPAFKIEKGIPMPASLRHKDRWTHLPFDKMEVGDSFVVDDMHSKEARPLCEGEPPVRTIAMMVNSSRWSRTLIWPIA